MGEAFLLRRGGSGANRLTVLTAPKTSYWAGERFDATGLLIGADFGVFVVPLDKSALTITPDRALRTTDTQMTVTATIGPRTLSVTIPITVSDTGELNDRTWAEIASIAELGLAPTAWSVGDIKYDYFNGSQMGFRIIGFNHDDLDETDSRYGDSAYNGGTNKAAITFQFDSAAGEAPMNATRTNAGGWDASRMRQTTMASDAGKLPGAARNALRTVKKYACGGGYGQANDRSILKSADTLFLLSHIEIAAVDGTCPPSSYEGNYTSTYEWHDSRSGQLARQWTRSCHRPTVCTDADHFCVIDVNGISSQGEANRNAPYFPAFCV